MRVYVTVDVELWPTSWDGYRAEIDDSYRRYILGRTARGSYGLPFQLEMARDHGLRFVFFVESLFACEFGLGYLKEIVHMIREAGQEVQLHVHPEWVRHATEQVVPTGERYLLDEFDESEQFRLIELGLVNLTAVGADEVRAFRAGSFAANRDTIAAVARVGLDVDSSFKLSSTLVAEIDDNQRVGGFDVAEYPLTEFRDWPGKWRHVQIASCSARELFFVMRRARELDWDHLVILSHSAELLNGSRRRHDPIVVKRFEQLCRFLADNSDEYRTAGFDGQGWESVQLPPREPIVSDKWRTLLRAGEQGVRRFFG